jgi:hypothetical protein
VLDHVHERLRRTVWHALNRYDELRRRVRENQAGRKAVGSVALLLLAGGAALGFIAANATAHEDVADPTQARFDAFGTITRTYTVTRQKTVRVLAPKQASSQSDKTVTITEPSVSVPARTILDVGTLTKTRTVTVTEIQPVTVTVLVTKGDTKTKP